MLDQWRGLGDIALAGAVVYLDEPQRRVDQPDGLTAGVQVLAHFLGCVLGKIAGGDDLNGERGRRCDRAAIKIEVLHSFGGEKGDVGYAHDVPAEAKID